MTSESSECQTAKDGEGEENEEFFLIIIKYLICMYKHYFYVWIFKHDHRCSVLHPKLEMAGMLRHQAFFCGPKTNLVSSSSSASASALLSSVVLPSAPISCFRRCLHAESLDSRFSRIFPPSWLDFSTTLVLVDFGARRSVGSDFLGSVPSAASFGVTLHSSSFLCIIFLVLVADCSMIFPSSSSIDALLREFKHHEHLRRWEDRRRSSACVVASSTETE